MMTPTKIRRRKQRLQVLALFVFWGIPCLIVLNGCNQNRYRPAEWRRGKAPSTTTLPGDSRTETLGMRGSTLPGSTLPYMGGTTLPGTTLPGTTLPRYRGTTLPGMRGSTLPLMPRPGTTLPGQLRTPRGTTLPRLRSLPPVRG